MPILNGSRVLQNDQDVRVLENDGLRTLESVDSFKSSLARTDGRDSFAASVVAIVVGANTVRVTGTVPTPTIGINNFSRPLVISFETQTYPADTASHEFAVPDVVTATASTPGAGVRSSSKLRPNVLMAEATTPNAYGSLKAETAAVPTILMTSSVGVPKFLRSGKATPLTPTAITSTPDVVLGLTQKIKPRTVTALASVPIPKMVIEATVAPGSLFATGKPFNASGGISHFVIPPAVDVLAIVLDAAGSISYVGPVTPALLEASLYGTGIVRTSSIVVPATLIALGYAVIPQPVTDGPSEWDGIERVIFTQVYPGATFEHQAGGIKYGRVKITPA